MHARGTVRNGRKNGISIQFEVFGIQIGAGNENFIANGLHWYDEWITLIKWNSAFEPKVIYCFFLLLLRSFKNKFFACIFHWVTKSELYFLPPKNKTHYQLALSRNFFWTKEMSNKNTIK